jgi:hypothetical protein
VPVKIKSEKVRLQMFFESLTIKSLKEIIRAGINQKKILALHDTQIGPIAAGYLYPNVDIVLTIPIAKCRTMGFLGLHCTTHSGHPFVDTLIAYARGEHGVYEGSALQRYYDAVQPKVASNLLGLSNTTPVDSFNGLSALQAIAPWWPNEEKLTPDAIEGHTLRRTEVENRENGSNVGAQEGISLWGPVSKTKGQLQFKRLVNIFESIRQNGYNRSDSAHGDIRGVPFLRDGSYVVNVSVGQHRIAALAALGHQEIPIRFSKTFYASTIRREEAEYWPNVTNDFYSLDQARRIFDGIFFGNTVNTNTGELQSIYESGNVTYHEVFRSKRAVAG